MIQNYLCKELVSNAPVGYACFEIELDSNQNPLFYILLDANALFCMWIQKNIVDYIRKATKKEFFFSNLKLDLDEIYRDTINHGKNRKIKREVYVKKKKFEMTAYSPEVGYLIVLFIPTSEIPDVSEEIKKSYYNGINNSYHNLFCQQKFYKILMDAIPEFIYYKDKNGVYLGCNKAAADKIYCMKEEDIIGKTDFQIIDTYTAEANKKQEMEAMNLNKPITYEEVLHGKELLILETSKIPLYNDNGEIMGVIGISRDITNKKVIEQKKLESEERLRQMAESIEEAFWLSTDSEMLYISHGFERIWERSCKIVYDEISNFRKFIYEEDKEKVFRALQGENYLIHGNFNEKYRIVKPDGTLRWVWERSFPIRNEKGEIVRRAGIAEDITTLKIAEEVVARTREEMIRVELQRKSMELNQLAELEKLRTDFFANLSHELRTPINLILAALKMIELNEKDIDEDTATSIKYFKIIKQNSYRLMRLINNLIDVTRLDAGFLTLNPSNNDIIGILRSITLSVAEYAKSKQISLDFKTDVEELIIKCDPDKIERILLNLLSNAIKFSKPGGRVEIVLNVVKKQLYIYVKDTGIGIPEDKLTMIFERFKQVDSRFTKDSEGSGIGLSLVKSLVKMHGGTISVHSTLGCGTQFLIKLPIKKMKESPNSKTNVYDETEDSRTERIRMEFSDIYGLTF